MFEIKVNETDLTITAVTPFGKLTLSYVNSVYYNNAIDNIEADPDAFEYFVLSKVINPT